MKVPFIQRDAGRTMRGAFEVATSSLAGHPPTLTTAARRVRGHRLFGGHSLDAHHRSGISPHRPAWLSPHRPVGHPPSPLGRRPLWPAFTLDPHPPAGHLLDRRSVVPAPPGRPSPATGRPTPHRSAPRPSVGHPPPPVGRRPIGRPSTFRRSSPIGPAASHPSVGRRRWLDGSSDCCCSWRVGSIDLSRAVLEWCSPWAVAAVECGGRAGARQGRLTGGASRRRREASLRDRFAALDSPRPGHLSFTRRPLPRERVPGGGLLAVPVCCRVAVACWPRASCGSDEAGLPSRRFE
ncbi:hypothetical protein JOD67_005969 [Tenggerimyces flavus]|nr:hypothetical protein [Tenggerimyces flavus]